jgi:hypothetical protein
MPNAATSPSDSSPTEVTARVTIEADRINDQARIERLAEEVNRREWVSDSTTKEIGSTTKSLNRLEAHTHGIAVWLFLVVSLISVAFEWAAASRFVELYSDADSGMRTFYASLFTAAGTILAIFAGEFLRLRRTRTMTQDDQDRLTLIRILLILFLGIGFAMRLQYAIAELKLNPITSGIFVSPLIDAASMTTLALIGLIGVMLASEYRESYERAAMGRKLQSLNQYLVRNERELREARFDLARALGKPVTPPPSPSPPSPQTDTDDA